MKEWTFKVFVDDDGISDFLIWREKLPAKVRAKMDNIITNMEAIKDWTRTKYFTPLSGHDGIGEIKFYIGNRRFRPLGCYGRKKKEFTMLVGAEEKNNRFVPLSAPDTASDRRVLVLSDGERYTDEY